MHRTLLGMTVMVCSLSASPLAGAEPCPADCEACRDIHGYVFVANGTPSVRFFDLDEGTLYGVAIRDEPDFPEDAEVPPELADRLTPFHEFYGDYAVCILDVPDGERHHFPPVRITAARNVAMKER